ncbi:hypothetical protein G7Y89_g8511 [Cudoniella acicularis]|uniref:Uncharacterized protein n=1 Tax=Cudoniella acicularis TaxID=354080 RepID=A0A8H4W0J7_9HELO|nr:hypothetical protein G7Y89_g8511 [Cudoniella acicularis]
MKFSILSVLALAAVVLATTMPQKAVIVSYPDDTPDSIITQAMDAVREAGGLITHEYKLIKYGRCSFPRVLLTEERGFACKAPAKILQQVQTWGNDYHAVIEEDQMVSAYGSGS